MEVTGYFIILFCGSLIFYHHQDPAIPPRDPDSQDDELDNVITTASEN